MLSRQKRTEAGCQCAKYTSKRLEDRNKEDAKFSSPGGEKMEMGEKKFTHQGDLGGGRGSLGEKRGLLIHRKGEEREPEKLKEKRRAQKRKSGSGRIFFNLLMLAPGQRDRGGGGVYRLTQLGTV